MELVRAAKNRGEMFASLQGEGLLIGKPVYFIRCAKCNLRCSWCDSKFSWEPGIDVPISSITRNFEKSGMPEIVITGGEPLLQEREVEKLVKHIWPTRVHVETNGTCAPFIASNVSYIVSPKLSNSGMLHYLDRDILKMFSRDSVFKFIVRTKYDVLEAFELSKLVGAYTVVFQVEGTMLRYKREIRKLWHYVVKLAKDAPFELRFLPQWHVVVFGHKRGV